MHGVQGHFSCGFSAFVFVGVAVLICCSDICCHAPRSWRTVIYTVFMLYSVIARTRLVETRVKELFLLNQSFFMKQYFQQTCHTAVRFVLSWGFCLITSCFILKS